MIENRKFKINGTVRFSGTQTDKQGNERQVVTLTISDDSLKKITELIGDPTCYSSTPIKESEKGEIYFKSQTQFDIGMYSKGSPDDFPLDEIGRDSDVTLFCKFKEQKVKRDTVLVAYLLSVNVLNLVPYEPFNAFEDDDIEEM